MKGMKRELGMRRSRSQPQLHHIAAVCPSAFLNPIFPMYEVGGYNEGFLAGLMGSLGTSVPNPWS